MIPGTTTMTRNKFQLRIEFGFEPDPDGGKASDPDLSASWGWFQLWAGPDNLCRYVAQSEVTDRTHWYLLPVLEWFVENWDQLLHEARFPKGLPNEVSARESYLAARPFDLPEAETDAVFRWWSGHALRAAADGGIFPDVFIRRHRGDLELSWGHATVPGAPPDLRFLQSKSVLCTPVAAAAQELFTKLGSAIQTLQKLKGSQRVTQLAKAHALLRKLPVDRGHWLAGIPVLPQWARGMLSADGPGIVIPTAPAPIALFGCLSPTIEQEDLDALFDVLRDAEVETVAQPLQPLVEVAASGNATDPWAEGYDWAERAHAMLKLDLGKAPVPIDECLTKLDVKVEDVLLRDSTIRAVALCGGTLQSTIALNLNCKQNQSEPGRRFTLAHELCHLLFDQEQGIPLAIASGPWAPKELEQRANAFAAMFLMPNAKVWSLAARFTNDGKWTTDSVRSMARELHVGRLPVLNHLHNLDLITADEFNSIQNELAG